jgi:hemerythrin
MFPPVTNTWGPHLEIGVPAIDAQHREIVETALDLVAALTIAETASVARILEVLAQHVLVHFETEERWMRESRYPRLRDHVAKHDQLVARLVALTRDHAEAGPSPLLALRVRNALAWLQDHTEEDDRKLARHVGVVASNGAATR